MLNDAWFLKVVRAQFEADRRLDRLATLTVEHAIRLLEMAERRHAEHDHDNDRVITEMVTSREDVA